MRPTLLLLCALASACTTAESPDDLLTLPTPDAAERADLGAADGAMAPDATLPATQTITSVTWDFAGEVVLAKGSDLWPTTWGADDAIWTGWGDGGGFGGGDEVDRVSVGFGKITGTPPSIVGQNVWGNTTAGAGQALYAATFCGKPESAISANGTLSVWIGSSYNDSAADSFRCAANPAVPSHVLAQSTDGGVTWTEHSWSFTEDDGAFVFNSFVNFGKDNAGAPGGYVYMYGWKVGGSNAYLARVEPTQLGTESAYQIFTGLDGNGQPTWTATYDTTHAAPAAESPAYLGATFYHAATQSYVSANFGASVNTLTMYEGPSMWGPWKVIEQETNWGGFGNDGESLALMFPTKWISTDGKTLWGVFSWGSTTGDGLHLMKATLTYGSIP